MLWASVPEGVEVGMTVPVEVAPWEPVALLIGGKAYGSDVEAGSVVELVGSDVGVERERGDVISVMDTIVFEASEELAYKELALAIGPSCV